jgi:hypothetical protein
MMVGTSGIQWIAIETNKPFLKGLINCNPTFLFKIFSLCWGAYEFAIN